MAFDKNKTIKKAQKYIQSGKIEAAIKEYVQIVQADPRDMASLQKLAGLYAKKQQVEDAVRCYETVGQSFTANGFYQKALAVYKLALQLDTRNGKLLHALAELYQTLGLRAEAVQHYRQAVALLREQDKFDEVLSVFERMLELSPDDQVIKAQLGEALFQAGRREEGIRVLKELSEMLKNEGKIEELGNFYERILALDARDEEVRKDLARVYVRQGMAPKALRHLKYLFDNDSADAEVFDLVARVYVLMGKNDKAVAAFLQKVAHLQDTQEIDRTYQRILEIDPTNEEALRHLGEDDDDGFDFETAPAVAVEKEAESVPPAAVQNDVTGGEYAAAINEASVYLKYGILDRAVEQLQEVIQSDPNNIDAHLKLLDAYEESGQKDQQATVFVQLAELYEAIGDISQSEKMVSKARAINPALPKLLEFTGEEAPAETGIPEAEPVAAEEADVLLGSEEDAIEVAFEDDVLAADDDGAAFLDDAGAIEEAGELDPFAVESDADALDVEIEVEEDSFIVDEEPALDEQAAEFETEPEAVDDSLDIGFEVEDIAVTEVPEEAPWQEDLEQADFLVEQEHYEEAEELLANLAEQYPDAEEVTKLLARVRAEREISAGTTSEEELTETSTDDGAAVFDLGDDGFDLASELESELDFLEDEGMAPGEEDVPTMEEIFSEFKKGVKEQLDDSDASAHYDLGIAYLEMGLTADAISEFELAAESPEKTVDALNMVGVAKVQLGDNAGAVEAYERALAVPDIHADASLNLNFEVANVLAEMQEYRRAVAHYKEVVAVDRNYRDVGEKIREMKAKLAGN